MGDPSSAAERNRRTWSLPSVAAEFGYEGWTDPGEPLAMAAFADRARGGRILDIGVGGGRTVSLLRLVASSYTAIDFAPAMVSVARRRHPHVDIRLGDARDLAGHDTGAYDGIVFSFNGIDAVSHEERGRVLAELRRALADGGHVLYSTLNKAGPDYRVAPWRARPLPWLLGGLMPARAGLVRGLVSVVKAVLHPGRYPRIYRNWWAIRHQGTDQGDWSSGYLAAHDYGLLVHFTTLGGELRRVRAAGFEPVAAFAAEDGRLLDADDDLSGVRWFHILARRLPG